MAHGQSNKPRKKKRVQEKTIFRFAYAMIYTRNPGGSLDKLLEIL